MPRRTPIASPLNTSLTAANSPEPAYIYALSLLPTATDTAATTTAAVAAAVCALTSVNGLHVLDPGTLAPLHTINTAQQEQQQQHTLLKAYGPNTLLTAGGQSRNLSLHDIRAPALSMALTAPHAVCSIAVAASTGAIAAGTERPEGARGGEGASVLVWDVRSPQGGTAAPLRHYTESHSDDITALAFAPPPQHGSDGGHRQHQQRLVSGGMDAQITVFDLSAAAAAKSGEADDEVDGAVVDVWNHGSSVRCLGWFGGGADVWALSHDEALAVYGGPPRGERRLGDVREQRPAGDAEYVVDVLPHPHPHLRPSDDEGEEDEDEGGMARAWVVAGNKAQQWVDLVPFSVARGVLLDGDGGYRLLGGHGAEVCRDLVFDAGVCFTRCSLFLSWQTLIFCWQTGTMYTGGEDGIVRAWRAPAAAATVAAADELPVHKQPKKTRKEDAEKKKRFRPY